MDYPTKLIKTQCNEISLILMTPKLLPPKTPEQLPRGIYTLRNSINFSFYDPSHVCYNPEGLVHGLLSEPQFYSLKSMETITEFKCMKAGITSKKCARI